jgi:hypothetical protein
MPCIYSITVNILPREVVNAIKKGYFIDNDIKCHLVPVTFRLFKRKNNYELWCDKDFLSYQGSENEGMATIRIIMKLAMKGLIKYV